MCNHPRDLSSNFIKMGSGNADFDLHYRLKKSKKEARTQKTEVSSKMESVRKNLKEVKTAEDAIESNLSAMCISGRNEYSKGRSLWRPCYPFRTLLKSLLEWNAS